MSAVMGGIALCGCSSGIETDYSKLGLAEVSGTVTLDGKPLEGAQVAFQDEQRRFSFGVTDASGDYELMFNTEKSGIIPGPKTVTISTAAAMADEGEDPFADDADGEEEVTSSKPAEQIPACYNRESTLNVNVEDGSQTIDFDLKSDCSTTGPSQ